LFAFFPKQRHRWENPKTFSARFLEQAAWKVIRILLKPETYKFENLMGFLGLLRLDDSIDISHMHSSGLEFF
jgi:hypothetical protein